MKSRKVPVCIVDNRGRTSRCSTRIGNVQLYRGGFTTYARVATPGSGVSPIKVSVITTSARCLLLFIILIHDVNRPYVLVFKFPDGAASSSFNANLQLASMMRTELKLIIS